MQQTAKQVSARFVAFFAAICMVMAMVPAMAFATVPTTGTFTLDATSVEVTSGTTANLQTLLKPTPNSDLDGDEYHFDYVAATGTTAFTVNKHSGVLTASTVGADTTGYVTVYLLAGDTPTSNNGKPCTGFTVLSSQVVTVDVKTSSTYGYQGNSMTMKMTSPTVTSYSGSNSTGWVNNLDASTPSSGYYNFTVKLSSGFKSYNTALAFAGINAGNVTVTDGLGSNLATLNNTNTGNLIISSVDNDTKTVNLQVASSIVTAGDTQLVFGSGFRGNNASNTLGTTITFVIN